MFLRRIFIRNYRQFRNVEIEFDNYEDKKISMIYGSNGTGKTNLLNAIRWCLYGTENHDYRNSSLGICNKKTENLALIGDTIEVRVGLEFLDGEDTLSFNRVFGFYKKSDGLIRNHSLDKFEMITKEGNEIRISDNAYYTIENKIPKEIEDYFLFDETRLNEYFVPIQLERLKDAIFSLTQINLVENVNSNIQKVKTNYIKQQKKISPKLGRANEEINDLENNIRRANERLEGVNKDIVELNDEIEKIDEELINRKSVDVQKSLIRNRELERRINKINIKLPKLENELEEYILLKYPYIMSYNSILKVIEISDDGFEKGVYYPRDVRFFIQGLLDSGKCVCGSDLSVDIEHRKVLENFLKNTEDAPDYVENHSRVLEHIKNVIIEDIKKFKSTSTEYHREIFLLNEEKIDLLKEKREIEARLNANPIGEIEILIKRRKELVEFKKRLEVKIINLKESIKIDEQKLGQQRKLLSHQEELYMEFIRYQKKIELCDGVNISTKYLCDNLKENLREKIQNHTKESLINSYWREGNFVDLIIDEDYEIHIKNNYGNIEKFSDLSDGEKIVLAICFICSLHRISGFDLPIILDASFNNLDSESRNNLINSLPDIIEKNQLIVLSKEEDYFTDLVEHMGKEYKISKTSSAEGIESEVILNG